MPGGRPEIYTDELAKRVCDVIATNIESYSILAEKDSTLPSEFTVRRWRLDYTEFSRKYLAARSIQADLLIEDGENMLKREKLLYQDDRGNSKIDPPSITLGSAILKHRHWVASKMLPKLYGDQHEIQRLQGEKDVMLEELKALRAQLDEQSKKDY